MAAVVLDKVWLHDAVDLSAYVTLKARDLVATPSRSVERRVRAGGRVQAVSTPAVVQSVSWEALQVDRATLAVLEGWLGRHLMMRGPRGRVLWGFYDSLPTSEQLWSDAVWLSMTFVVVDR